MPLKDDSRKRDRKGRFSKYDHREQADRGHRAHENLLQTGVRRMRWLVGGFFRSIGRLFGRGCRKLVAACSLRRRR